MEMINSISAGHKSQTCFTPIMFQPPFFGAASNCMLRYLFPLSVKFISTLSWANQCSVAKVQSLLQPRTDETYKSKLGPVCFFQQAKFSWFFFCISLTHHFVACSLNYPKPSSCQDLHNGFLVGPHAMAHDSADIRLTRDLGSRDLLVHYLIT